jgi:hypothetical protein
MTPDVTPREARVVLDIFRQGGDRPEVGIDLHAVAARLGCQPDLVSIREALEGVVGRG